MAVYLISALLAIGFALLAAPARAAPSGGSCDAGRPDIKLSYRFYAFLSFLPLFLISALREGISFDYYYTYVPVYYTVAAGGSTHCELGYVLLNKLIYYVFNNVDWVFIITSFIFLIALFVVIYERSVSIPLSIFLLIGTRLYYTSFGQIRQYIVIAIFLYSLKYIEQNKLIKYFLITLIASSIHTLALVYLPVYFVCKKKVSRHIYALSALTLFAAAPLLKRIYSYFAQLLYSQYDGYGTTHISELMLVMTLFVFLLTIVYYHRIPQTKYNVILVNLQWIAAVFGVTTIGISESYRLLGLFMYSSVLLVPQIIKSEESSYVRWLLLITIIALFSAAAVHYLLTNAYMLPYKTIFSG